MRTCDLDLFLRDFGTECNANNEDFIAIFDTPTDVLHMGASTLLSNQYELTMRTSDAVRVGVDNGVSVTVECTSYLVRERLLLDDGAFSKVSLSKVQQ